MTQGNLFPSLRFAELPLVLSLTTRVSWANAKLVRFAFIRLLPFFLVPF